MVQGRPITQEDRLWIYAAVQADFGGDPGLAEIVCTLAKTIGVERALLDLNRALASLWSVERRPPS